MKIEYDAGSIMGLAQARLFSWLQQADFYMSFHEEAVEKLAPGHGETWIDVGCGPGLLTRLAARRGYQSVGIDADRAMVESAVRFASSEGSSARFSIGTLANLHSAVKSPASVVSAASLLAVLHDRVAGLESLWDYVAPGGTLFIIEPTYKMTRRAASSLIDSGLVSGKRTIGLRLWASAREGGAVDSGIYDEITDVADKRVFPLLHGLVGLWLIRKKG